MRSPAAARVVLGSLDVARSRSAVLAVRLVATLAVALATSPRPAHAYYEESHVTADDARITVDSSGTARIEHSLTWRVVAGQPHSFDLVGTEPSAQADVTATIESDDGRTLTAIVAPVGGRGLRVTMAEPKAIHHGQQYRVKLAYTVDLAAAGELLRDGSMYRLVWKAPLPSEGYESPKVTFVLPSALEAPSPFLGDGGMRDDGVVGTVRRDPDHDEVELVRPHVGRGEEVAWAVRIAAKAFEAGRATVVRPPPPRRDDPSGPTPLTYGLVALLAAAFAFAVRIKERVFEVASRSSGARTQGPAVRGLVPLRTWERAAAAGAALFVGLSLQLVDASLAGAAAIVVAMVCTILRPTARAVAARGPGHWLVIRPEEAFRRNAIRGVVGLTHLSIAVMLGVAFGAFVALGHALRGTQPEATLLLPLDALVVVPLFATGLLSQVAPNRSRRGGAWLRRVFSRLQRVKGLRVSPWARVPTGLIQPDEVRVLVLPRDPIPGLSAIEVGLSWGPASTSFVASPEVLVRVREASAASARMTSLASEVLPVPGRKPEERVYRLAPRVPTWRAAAALAASLANRLVDRRGTTAPWADEERRIPPNERAEPSHNAPSAILG